MAINVRIERLSANGRVEVRYVISVRIIVRQREITNGGVVTGVNVLCECLVSQSVIKRSIHIGIERKCANSVVVTTSVVVGQRFVSVGYILKPREIAQQCCGANCSIRVPDIKAQRSSAKTSIEAVTIGIGEGIPTNRCISDTGGQELQRIASFRSCEQGIAPVRCRSDCARSS